MSIFELHSQVLDDYRDFVRSFLVIADGRTRGFVHRTPDEGGRLWPDPLLQVSPSHARSATVNDLAGRGVLLEETARIFRAASGHPYQLYQHQVEAIALALSGLRTPAQLRRALMIQSPINSCVDK